MSREFATIIDYDGLIAALRARLAELNITHTTFDRLAGWPQGYGGKVFGDARVKALGPMSLGLALQVLALKLIVVEDVEGAEHMGPRWEQRVRPDYNASRQASIGKRTVGRMIPVIAREMQKRSCGTRPAAMRRRIARQAARARWGKPRRKPRPVSAP